MEENGKEKGEKNYGYYPYRLKSLQQNQLQIHPHHPKKRRTCIIIRKYQKLSFSHLMSFHTSPFNLLLHLFEPLLHPNPRN